MSALDVLFNFTQNKDNLVYLLETVKPGVLEAFNQKNQREHIILKPPFNKNLAALRKEYYALTIQIISINKQLGPDNPQTKMLHRISSLLNSFIGNNYEPSHIIIFPQKDWSELNILVKKYGLINTSKELWHKITTLIFRIKQYFSKEPFILNPAPTAPSLSANITSFWQKLQPYKSELCDNPYILKQAPAEPEPNIWAKIQ